jgi:NAD(P)-dependent dehydrogenase (short-subunit alcohol dehydrogenase family)
MIQIFLVTGASKGIGFETARQLIEKGHDVIVGARTFEKAKSAVLKLGPKAYPFKLDVTKMEDRQAVVKFISEKWKKLDGLINNAGVFLEKDFDVSNAATVEMNILKETFESNFFGLIELTQKCIPLLKKADVGRIVNVTSLLGSLNLHADKSSPIYGLKSLAYNSSKTALNAFTVHLAHALLNTNIKVNSVNPGWVKTDMGGEMAPMLVGEGAKTSVEMALLGIKGPSGKYVHLGEIIPW